MKLSLVSSIFLLAASAAAAAKRPSLRPRLAPPALQGQVMSVAEVAAANGVTTNGTGFFTQLLDHSDPSKGTFQQQYWWNSEFWKGPGSPVSAALSPMVLWEDRRGRVIKN